MDFVTWLRTWLARHPLKGPAVVDRARYTDEVMARVRATQRPEAAPSQLGAWWRVVPRFALAAAAAAMLVVAYLGRQPGHDPAQRMQELATIEEEVRLLSLMDEPIPEDLEAAEDPDALAEELETLEGWMVAEAPSADEEWIESTLSLLEALEEGVPADASDEILDEDEWLEELDELSAGSLRTEAS